MNKIVTLLAAAVATFSFSAQAQITINQSDYSTWTPRLDTFQDLTATVALSANAQWDFSTATYDPNFYSFRYIPYSNASLSGATFSYLSGYGFSSLFYMADIAGGINSNGVQELGENVPAQALDLSALTTKAGDSLIFPAQLIPYSAPRTRISFPLTFGKTWTSTFSRSTNFILKYGGNPYSCSRKNFATQVDSVNGWGRVRIKRLDGSNSGWMDVLGVKTKVTTEDSFYMPGAPASTLGALLRGFGLKQGMRDSTHMMELFRKGEVEPLLVVGYADTTYTTADFASVHQSRIPANVGVNNLPESASISLYPNPATATSGFNIDLVETAPGTWSYSLLDASGKIISSATIQPAGGKAHIDAVQAAPGTYFLNVQKDGQQVATKPVVIKN